jgi:hypothetical protein
MRDSLNHVHRLRDDLMRIVWVSGCLVLVQRHGAHRNGFSGVFPGTGRTSLKRISAEAHARRASHEAPSATAGDSKRPALRPAFRAGDEDPVGSTTTDTFAPGFGDLKIERPAFDCAAGDQPGWALGSSVVMMFSSCKGQTLNPATVMPWASADTDWCSTDNVTFVQAHSRAAHT